MPDIPLLDLATTWAEAASERPEIMLLRLCDWAVLEAFPPLSFIDRTGAPVDVFDMWISARAIITAAPIAVEGWVLPTDPGKAHQHLRAIYVTLTGLSAFCRQTSILLPPLLLHGFFRRCRARRRIKYLAPPPPPPGAEEAVAAHERKLFEAGRARYEELRTEGSVATELLGGPWIRTQRIRSEKVPEQPPPAGTADANPNTGKKSRKGPPKGAGSFAASDAKLFPKIEDMMKDGSTLKAASETLARGAEGIGSEESKATRLQRGYREWVSQGRKR